MTHVNRQSSKIGENNCGGEGVMIYLYVQAQNQKKYNKTLNIEKIDVGCSLEWFYGLNTSVVVSFTQVHHKAFKPALKNLGQHLWWCRLKAWVTLLGYKPYL
jgi:hypothetical protein